MILIFIGIVLIKNIDGKAYSPVHSSNCSQTFFDEATLNYLASFKFLPDNVDATCPYVKAIAFRKTDLLEVQMDIEVVGNIWNMLTENDRFLLMFQLRNRLHYSCNSISLSTELCRTKYALEGGVFISTYDGSLSKHPFHKSCSICLLKTIVERPGVKNDDLSLTLPRVNLSLFDIVDWKEVQPDEILSVKFIRMPYKNRDNSEFFLGSLLGRSVPYQSTLISDSITYNVKARLLSGGSQIFSKRGQNSTNECIFRCDWSSKCLSDTKSICDKVVDCRYGDDEHPLVCQLYNRLNHSSRLDSSVRKLFNAVHNKSYQNEDYLKFVIPVIFAVLVIVFAGIGVMIFYRRNKRRDIINRKIANISDIDFSRIRHNSIYLQKPSLEALTVPHSLQEMLIESQQDRSIDVGWCTATFHQKNSGHRQLIHPKAFRKPRKSDRQTIEQYSDLCKQINYPDLRTRSNWLRAYFQLSRSDHGKQRNPPVLNVASLPPVSFSCRQ